MKRNIELEISFKEISLHIIDDIPDNEITEEMQLSLDDVYLHYFE